MAVQDEASFKRYAANGIATVYAIPFLLLNAADLRVVLDDVEVTTGFTVSGVGTNTGSITFSVAPSGDLLLQRVVPFDRLTDYQDNGDLLADTVNRDFDRLWLAMQELRRDDSTALRTSSLEPEGIPNLPLAATRASRVLAFGPTGDPVVSSLTIDELEQQPAMAIAAAEAAVAAAGAASSSASASSASATASANSATAAGQEKDKAQQWAEEAEDVPVEPGLYSAKHWAAKAAGSVSGLDARVTALEAKGIRSGTAQATASGTSIDFTSLPAGIKKITIALSVVSTNGTSNPIIQLGTSGGIENSGYGGGIWQGNASNASNSNGFLLNAVTAAANNITVIVTLTNISGNQWVASVTGNYSAGVSLAGGGAKTLSGTLNRIRLTTAAGTDTFDAGLINIIHES